MKTKKTSIWYFLFLLVLVINGYGQTMQHMDMKSEEQKAICKVYPTEGNNVTGTITFIQTTDGVRIVGDIHGLTPGKHGFHIHEFGDCSSVDGSSAGGHYNPMNMQHGAPMDMNRHEGDMGNIVADASGNAHIEYIDHAMTLSGTNSIIGRSVVVHKGEDDLKTQPTGNSGQRVACGVIGLLK